MQRLPVESSDIVSIGYDEKSQLLEIEFHGGRVYRYRDVEPDAHKHFMRAESPGRYFNTYINNRYRYQRIDEQESAKQQHNAIAFVTGNARKARDLALACKPYGIAIEQLDLPVDEIQSDDPEEVALKKAKYAYKLAGRPVIVLDSFWNIIALRGFPGAYMSYVAKWFAAEDFLKLMEGKSERTIILTETAVYYDGKRHKIISKDYSGTLAAEPRGTGFASLDQILIMNGQTKTVAQIEDKEGRSSLDPLDDTVYTPLAKWLHLQRRLGKV